MLARWEETESEARGKEHCRVEAERTSTQEMAQRAKEGREAQQEQEDARNWSPETAQRAWGRCGAIATKREGESPRRHQMGKS